MGVIQGSINNMLGTAAVAAGVGKGLKEKGIENKMKQAEATTKIAELSAEVKAGSEEIAKTTAVKKAISSGINPETASYNPVTKKVMGPQYSIFSDEKELMAKQAYDTKKLSQSLKVMRANQAARKTQIEAYQKVLGGKK